MKCNQSCAGLELVSPCTFPTTITITPRSPPCRMAYKIFFCFFFFLVENYEVASYPHSLIIFFLFVQAAKEWITEKETGILLKSTFNSTGQQLFCEGEYSSRAMTITVNSIERCQKFLSGARKPIFSCTYRLRFRWEVSWEILYSFYFEFI